jgi:hypothetical protein
MDIVRATHNKEIQRQKIEHPTSLGRDMAGIA